MNQAIETETESRDYGQEALANLQEAQRTALEMLQGIGDWLSLSLTATSCMTSMAQQLEEEIVSDGCAEITSELQTGAETFASGVTEIVASANLALSQVLSNLRKATEAVTLAI